MNWILIKAVIKARREGLLHLVPAEAATRFDCLTGECVKCCEALGLPVVTEAVAQTIGYRFIEKRRHGMFIKSQDSRCCLLKDGLCTIYSDRPKGCREYPWYNLDGRLYYDAGCPGVKHDRDERPNVDDIEPFENFFPGIPKIVLWLIKKACLFG